MHYTPVESVVIHMHILKICVSVFVDNNLIGNILVYTTCAFFLCYNIYTCVITLSMCLTEEFFILYIFVCAFVRYHY